MNNTNLQLRHSELIYLLWLMKTLPIPGIDSNPIYDTSSEGAIARLAAAEQSLQERGLIAVQETGTRIDQHVLILVGSCAMAKATLFAESQHKEIAPENLSFHYYAKTWVRHVLLEMGIHRFDLIDSPLTDCTELIGTSPSHYAENPPPELTLPKTTLDKVFMLFSKNRLAGLHDVLKISGLSDQTIPTMIDTLGDLQQKIFIGVTYHYRAENIAGESVVLLRNPHGLLQLDTLIDTEMVKLFPITQQAAIELLNHIVQQAQVS